MNNLNNDNKNTEYEDLEEYTICIDPTKIILTILIGWVLCPILLKDVISTTTINAYLLWFCSCIGIKTVYKWVQFAFKSPTIPLNLFRFSHISKITNFIYILINLLVQISLVIFFIRMFYSTQEESLMSFASALVHPLISTIAMYIGGVIFFKKPTKEVEDK